MTDKDNSEEMDLSPDDADTGAPPAAFASEFYQRYEVNQAIAWWLASELIRRHPGDVRVFETHPHMYDCLSVCRRIHGEADEVDWQLMAFLNKLGMIHPSASFSAEMEPITWTAVFAAEDPRRYVREIEAGDGLSSPAKTPSTRRSSIVGRCIAGFLARTVFLRDRWLVLGGAHRGDWDAVVRDELFAQIATVDRARRERPRDDYWNLTESRFWFLVDRDGDRVRLAFDQVEGRAWTPNGSQHDLMDLYQQANRSVDRLVSGLFPAAF